MEWNTKWDWDNVVAFGSKAIGSPKKLHLADWMIVDGGEIQCGSFNLSSGGGNSGASASDGANGSSAKSSISASTDSSTKDGMQTPSLSFTTYEGSSRKKIESKGMEVSGTHTFPDASVGSAEALLGLKLGKRTYFENSNGGTAKSTTFHTPATTTLTKTKSSAPNAPVCCQVEGCNIDLTLAKEYHRKHRVCDGHSKSPKVIVGGRERRFCQQCSRFHGLSEFDEKKRSCRRRLLDHNARRRKPQQETIRFDSTRLSMPIYGGNQQMSFLLSNSQPGRDSACNSKFTLTQGYPLKSNGDGVTDKQLHMPGYKVQNAVDGLLARNNSTSLVSDPDAAPEYRRALSLLSSNSWGSCDPEPTPLHHQMEENHSRVVQPMSHATPEGVPLSSSQFWLSGQHSTHPHVPSLATSNNFQEIQLFKSLYDPDFYKIY